MLLNNGNFPTIELQLFDGKLACIVVRPVLAGEQIFMSYHDIDLYDPKEERQKTLKKLSSFNCQYRALMALLWRHENYRQRRHLR